MINISYKSIAETVKKNNGLVKVLNILDKAITYVTVILYALFLLYAALTVKNSDFTLLYRSILIPAVSFIVVSVFRYVLSAPRPYEVYSFEPAIKKDTKGKSFPSRHVFSIFMVAMTYLQVSLTAAILISIMGLMLCVLRVIGGVHFLKDVICGALTALLCGFLGFGVICGIFNLCVLVF